jgi:hypothetical protein
MWVKGEMHTEVLSESLDVGGRIILEWILET